MSELTLPQRMMRPIINFLVERFYPAGCFYGDGDPMRTFDGNSGGTIGRAAVMVLIRKVSDSGADKLGADFDGVTVNGEPIGDWRVTVQRKAWRETGGER